MASLRSRASLTQLSQGARLCANDGVGGEGGWGKLLHNTELQNGPGYFPNELHDSLHTHVISPLITKDKFDFGLDAMDSDSAILNSDLQNFLEINFDFQDYQSENTPFENNSVHQHIDEKPAPDFMEVNLQMFSRMDDDFCAFNSLLDQHHCQDDDVMEHRQSLNNTIVNPNNEIAEHSRAVEYEAMKAYVHLEETTHPPLPSIVQDNFDGTNDLRDFLCDLNNFDPNHISDLDPSSQSFNLIDPTADVDVPSQGISLLGQSLTFSGGQPFNAGFFLSESDLLASTSSLSASTSSSSLSSLCSSSPQPLLPSSPARNLFPAPSPSTLHSLKTSIIKSPPLPTSSPLIIRPEKRQRKKDQNKSAALRYREKKRSEYGDFMKECEETEQKNAQLKVKVQEISKEIKYLRTLMAEISAI